MSRALALSWAIGLGLLAGSIAGTLVPATTSGQELRHVVGLTLVFVPAVYVMVRRRWTYWTATNGYLRFAVYLLSFLVTAGVLMVLSVVAFGASGPVATGATFLAAAVAFSITAWLTFYGGADRLWAELIDRTDIE
ncbi:hypothetical protein [Saliphagus sp. LR7]|uniref:hypothetical protein n=1 Tax=Saliphagus sp. LR7 TaxID=2282654 RepID=UPI0013003B42|nr:hypothetical protein [Saliphagus sp. LR7]